MQSEAVTSALSSIMPIALSDLNLTKECTKVGLVIVDEVNGFASVGAGNLAPPAPNEQVSTMVSETDRIAKEFTKHNWPILAFLDTHEPGKAEPPYPPHCEAGTGEEELVPELKWLERDPNTYLVRKDCINGFVGSIDRSGNNLFVDWVNENEITDLVVVGICTDICVMDFVLTSLSARNHGMMASLANIHVYDKGCSTYDLPIETAIDAGLPDVAAHPQNVTHYMGLYFMASRGANLIQKIEF